MEDFDFKYDKSNYIDIINSKSSIIKKGVVAAQNYSFKNEVNKIIIMGLGGSGLAGRLIKQYLEEISINIKIVVVNDYNTKEKIDSKTAVFVCSYSGNTEEAVYFFNKYSYSIGEFFVLTTNGLLLKDAEKKKDVKIIRMPSGLPPRVASTAMFFSILKVLENSNIVKDHTMIISNLLNFFEDYNNKRVLTDYSKNLALKIKDKIPLIYTTSRLESLGYFWKISFNENSKVHAFNNKLPEFNHNELNAFDYNQNFYIIFLIDEADFKRNRERVSVLREMFLKLNIENTTIMLKGNSLIAKYFNSIYLAELTSYFLALLLEKDPIDVKVIEEFKRKMSEKKFFYK